MKMFNFNKLHTFDDLMIFIHNYRTLPVFLKFIQFNYLNNNIYNFIDLCNDNNILIFINELEKNPEFEPIIENNSHKIYKKFGIKTILQITQRMAFEKRWRFVRNMYASIRHDFYSMNEFIDDLLANNETDYLYHSFIHILYSYTLETTLDSGLLKRIKQIFPEKYKDFLPIIVSKMAEVGTVLLDSLTLNALTTIVSEIAENEHTDLFELEYIGSGSFSNVYRIGNKVIKFGENRTTHKIPYHKRILQPLIRRQILPKKLYIEISEYIPPDKSITDEEAYLVYKELRDDGIIWIDAKKENLGRLEKDNIIHFNEPLHIEDESVGYIIDNSRTREPLKKGELVIIDTDLLFRENDLNLYNLFGKINTFFYDACERRYQYEKSFNGKNDEEIHNQSSLPDR